MILLSGLTTGIDKMNQKAKQTAFLGICRPHPPTSKKKKEMKKPVPLDSAIFSLRNE